MSSGNSTTRNDASANDSNSNVGGMQLRLSSFRKWLSEDAGVRVHQNLTIVADDELSTTKTGVVDLDDISNRQQPQSLTLMDSENTIDVIELPDDCDRSLYDGTTMGCQVRGTDDINKAEILMEMPRSAMITPDLVASSDAGRAVLACMEPVSESHQSDFWMTFENTTFLQNQMEEHLDMNDGKQLIQQIIGMRSQAEEESERKTASEGEKAKIATTEKSLLKNDPPSYSLIQANSISTRAPFLAFLIHQRFSKTGKPKVDSSQKEVVEQLGSIESGLSTSKHVIKHTDTPDSFGPYAQVLPSFVPLPLCWTPSELALLSKAPSGVSILQEVATTTRLLAQEFLLLKDAGLLERFPSIFSEGLMSWKRWVWAASVFSSRVLPAGMYVSKEHPSAELFAEASPSAMMQTDPIVWDELGVMVPFLDMMNHSVEANQVTWQPAESTSTEQCRPPRAVSHGGIKGGDQVFINYGLKDNRRLILDYGFAMVENPSEKVCLGWGLGDAVGEVQNAEDPDDGIFCKEETFDAKLISEWWTPNRLQILKREAMLDDNIVEMLSSGNKMVVEAYNDDSYHPGLLVTAVVATMDHAAIEEDAANTVTSSTSGSGSTIGISERQGRLLRAQLGSFLSRKMDRLLRFITDGLAQEYGPNLCSVSDYKSWQSFLECQMKGSVLSIREERYAVGPASCCLVLYDGDLGALKRSLEGVSTTSNETFPDLICSQMKDLGFHIILDVNDINNDNTNITKKTAAANKRVKISHDTC